MIGSSKGNKEIDKMNPVLDFLVTASESNLETLVQSQMLTNETAPMNSNLEHPDIGCTSLTGTAQKGNTESGEGSLDVNCNNLKGLIPLTLTVQDVDMLEKLMDLAPAEYRPVKIVQELPKHHERSLTQYAAQMNSTVGKHLTDVLPNHLSLQDNFVVYGEKNGINVDLSICGSQVSNEDSENTNCLTSRNTAFAVQKSSTSGKRSDGTNTEFQSLTQGQQILLYLNAGKNTLEEMICVYNELETSRPDTILADHWNGLNRKKLRHSSLPDEILLAPMKLRRPSSLNLSTRWNKKFKDVPSIEVSSGMQHSQSKPNISDTEIHLDSSQDSKTHIQQKLKKQVPADLECSSGTLKISLPQLSTSHVRFPVPVQLLPIQGKRVTDKQSESDISNTTVITLPSKRYPHHSLSPHQSITRRKKLNRQSLAQSYRQKTANEFTSASAPSNQSSFNMDECPEQYLDVQPSETGFVIENNDKLLSLPPPMLLSKCADCVTASPKSNNEELLGQELAKCLCAKDVTHMIPSENNTECTSAGSDKKYKCKEPDITGTNLTNEEVFDANYSKDDIVLLDEILCKLNLEINKSLVNENMSADVVNSAAVGPNQNIHFQNVYNTKILTNEAVLCRQEIKPTDNLFQGDKARESISHKDTAQNLAENFEQSVAVPKQIVRTKNATYVKENIAGKDMKTDSKSNSAVHVTVAKQSPTKAQHFSKKAPVKRKNTSYGNANHNFNILAWKEREEKKMSKINCVNQKNIAAPERNKSSSKSLQCHPIPTQGWLRKGTLMPSTAHFLKRKKGPCLPSLENPDLHQVSSKVQLKAQGGIKCHLKNGSFSNELSLPCINRNSNSLNKSPIPRVLRSHSTNDFSALKYSDMFQEINPTDKGPGIYEMFGTPVYCIMRESTTRETNHRVIHSAPPRRRSTCKNSKSNQLIEKNTAKNTKSNQNSRHKKNHTNVKKKSVDALQNGERNSTLFNSNEGQENVIISGHDWYIKTFRNEILHEINSQEDSGHLSGGSGSPHSLPDYEADLDNQYLSTIMEVSLHQTSVKSVISEGDEDICKESSSTSVNGGDQCKPSMLSKTKNTDETAVDLFELQQNPSKRDKDDVDMGERSEFLQCQWTTNTHKSTTALSNKLNWDVIDDETESTALCTVEDQANSTSSIVKAASSPDLNHTSFPVQPLINMWTAEKMCPAHSFECGSQDTLTDELVSCLASALLFEEKNTCADTVQVVKQFQQEDYDSKDSLFQNANGKMVNEKNLQSAEYTVKKLFKISSRPNSSLGHSIKSECSSSCEDAIIWTKGNVLGKGAYGTVYCGLTSQGQLIAVKQVSLDATNQIAAEKEYQKLEEEIELLTNLKHVNIVSFLGTNLEANVVSIFMEFVPGGSIAGVISRFGPLPEPVFCTYTQQILKGVDYLHDNRVIHRDIKGNNVMLMPNGVIKLIDFGCAKRMTFVNMSDTHSEMLKSMHGTPYWMAPEVINETGHGKKSDIWSIGCTVFEMASGKPPLAHMDKMAAMFYIGAHRGLMPTLPEEFSENARDFIQICLTSDQHERPSAKQLLQHPFIVKKQKQHSRKTKL
ncbi:mitogen-activated protein kinase kinase kinase 19 isoform X2 [Heterodontus francisci]|uniref:mitogen-activated protein kinase kinase kinase 19 isoform X2 n=1 Tax=Heterodontus francisci TaxID=7792 RepID=UPI00355C5B13